MFRIYRGLLFSPLLLIFFLTVPAAAFHDELDLTTLSLTELYNVEITTVSKRGESLAKAKAAVHVITQEDIRRSGATSIPELLRLAPGMNVAQVNSNTWAISARGFNWVYAGKLLVLIDGRTVYNHIFSGVFWDEQDYVLEDIERIEVIRGPGAALWGANAENGVINIITKKAKDTQGGILSAGGGDEEQGFGTLRYGGQLNDNTYYRIYTKYFDRDSFKDTSDSDAHDEWDQFRSGFRLDSDLSEDHSLTLQGDIYNGESGIVRQIPVLTPPYLSVDAADIHMSGGNILARWESSFTYNSKTSFQLYYDRARREENNTSTERNTFDLEFQHNFPIGDSHYIIWGLGYRFIKDDLNGDLFISFDPETRDSDLYSAFLQDDITLIEDRLYLTAGTKLEHNDYSGFEIQPSLRMSWLPLKGHTAWAAISKAVRTPNRLNHDATIPFSAFPNKDGSTILLQIYGNDDVESHNLTAYELGYRFQPAERTSIDFTAFYNDHGSLITIEQGNTFYETNSLQPYLVVPLYFDNEMKGESYGAELTATYQVTKRWKLTAWYTWLEMQLHQTGSSTDTTSAAAEGYSPKHQFHIRSNLDLPYHLELDTALYYVDSLPELDISDYFRFDIRLGWRPASNLEVSIAGQNLLDDRHEEFLSERGGIGATEIERVVYGKVTWRF